MLLAFICSIWLCIFLCISIRHCIEKNAETMWVCYDDLTKKKGNCSTSYHSYGGYIYRRHRYRKYNKWLIE